MEDKKYLDEILKSREDRYLKQEEIIKKYPFSLISFTLNIPGKIKDTDLYIKIHKEGLVAIDELIKTINAEVKNKELIYKNTGAEGFISIDIDSISLKELTVQIEEKHPLGRIFDIDIFDSNHNQVTRNDINKQARKCLICEDIAINCIKLNTHNTEELLKKIDSKVKEYFR